MPSCAEAIIDFLCRAGARRMYGIPGEGASLDLLEAGHRHGLEFVLGADEGAAAIMAATEGELLGRPGICLTGPGPGAAQAVRGLAHAYVDRSPLIVCTDRSSYERLSVGGHRSLDHILLLKGVVKSGTTLTAARAERLIARAWHEACRIPAGPVHLDIPTDEARRPVRGRPAEPPAGSPAGPSASTIRSAARLMTRRGRAVVVAGMGCRGPRAVRALRELVGHLGAPVLTTPKAKGVLPEDHPLSAGVFMGGKLDSELLGRADTILVAGVDPVELLARPWRVGAEVLLLAEYRIGARPFRPAVEVVADLADGLEALRAALPPAGEWGLANWAAQARAFKGEVRERLAEADRGRGGIAPHRVVSLVREAAPREARVAVDSGGHALLVASFWESYAPGGYLCSGGLAAPGYALPAAVAAGLVEPEVPLVAFIGDGGLLMSLGSLATAAKRKIPLTVVVFVDASLTLVRALQERRRYAPLGIALPEIGIPEVAAGLGARGISVGTEAELTAALQEAFAARQPAVIAVRVRPGGYRRMLDVLWGAAPA